jgi:hypothetical protein
MFASKTCRPEAALFMGRLKVHFFKTVRSASMAKESLFCLIVLPSVLPPGGRIKDFSVQWICGNDN